jgi:HEAT repeat protein
MLATALRRMPGALGKSDRLQKFIIGGGEERCRRGMLGFHLLGPAASGAAPELTERMSTRASPSGGLCADALGEIGKEGLPPLVEALTNIQALNRVDAVAAIGLYIAPTNGVSLVPVLAKCLSDKDPVVAALSVRALGHLGTELYNAVPPLTEALKDPRPHMRVVALQTVGDLGPRGRVALPLLMPLLNDSDLGARREATNTLQKIAPEVSCR